MSCRGFLLTLFLLIKIRKGTEDTAKIRKKIQNNCILMVFPKLKISIALLLPENAVRGMKYNCVVFVVDFSFSVCQGLYII